MPNIKSQKKRVLTNNKKHASNVSERSAIKTAIKKVLVAVDANDKEAAMNAYNVANSKLDKAITSGLHHKNYVARQKARLSNAINKMA
ncbi:MAG: 30S ribosomal protein S20 [Traorella sp.]